MLWHGAWVSKITGSDRQPCYLSCLSTFLNRCSLGCLNANVLPYRWGAVFQLPWWSGQCSVRWVMYNSSGVPWFFSPDNSPCAQHSVSWSQTCRRLYATDCLPSWEHDTGTLPVTFLIILQMNFPWLVEWEPTCGWYTALPRVFTSVPWGKSAFPRRFQMDKVALEVTSGFF